MRKLKSGRVSATPQPATPQPRWRMYMNHLPSVRMWGSCIHKCTFWEFKKTVSWIHLRMYQGCFSSLLSRQISIWHADCHDYPVLWQAEKETKYMDISGGIYLLISPSARGDAQIEIKSNRYPDPYLSTPGVNSIQLSHVHPWVCVP